MTPPDEREWQTEKGPIALRLDALGWTQAFPEPVIRQRYERGLANFFNLYRPLADRWVMYDNSASEPRLVAMGHGETMEILDQQSWNAITKGRI